MAVTIAIKGKGEAKVLFQGDVGIRNYWKEKNTVSLDGHPTGIK